jgi:hypothetical protein
VLEWVGSVVAGRRGRTLLALSSGEGYLGVGAGGAASGGGGRMGDGHGGGGGVGSGWGGSRSGGGGGGDRRGGTGQLGEVADAAGVGGSDIWEVVEAGTGLCAFLGDLEGVQDVGRAWVRFGNA